MKSKRTQRGLTQSSTPKTLVTESDDTSLVSQTSFLAPNKTLQDFMAHTLDNHPKQRFLNRTASLPRTQKSTISILPLTREKVKVSQRGCKRLERGTADPAVLGRATPLCDLQSTGCQKYK